MNINKNKNLMLAAAVVILLNFNSCGKYDDGPKFSLKGKTSRLVGEWEVVDTENAKIEYDTLSINVENLDNVILEFEKEGDFTVSFDYEIDYYGFTYTFSSSENGEWEWGSNKETVEIDMEKSGNLEFEIMRLSNDELWFQDKDNNLWECEKVK